MSLKSLLGQPTAQKTLARALETGRVHHAYRFEGPPGVGKETAAFLLAQALLCESSSHGQSEGGCGACSACSKVVSLSSEAPFVPRHPDVLLVARGLYPPSVLGGASEAVGISVEQVRRIVLTRVGFPPHEGRALVVIVRDADELTVSAANALLKTLEEPHRGTHFILITSRPAKLLDTIVSRTLAVRFGTLPESVMKTLLRQQELPEDLVVHAQGSLERARSLADPEARAALQDFLQSLDETMSQSHPAAALRWAEKRPEGRAELLKMLGFVATAFAERARSGKGAALWAKRHAEVGRSMTEVERNGSPALVLEALATRLIET